MLEIKRLNKFDIERLTNKDSCKLLQSKLKKNT